MPYNRIFFTAIALTGSILSISQCLYAQHRASTPLPGYKVNEYPFNMVGKVYTEDTGGSGTAISQKVVLSAAHVFFGDEILGWYPGSYKWYLRLSPSTTRSSAVIARSYRYFSDYAEAARRFDPGDSTHSLEQFNRDVMCLIFYENVANGGYAGWGSNRIYNSSDKMIVGYPNLNYSDSDPRNRTMHSTSLEGSPTFFNHVHYDDRLNNTRRLYRTDDLSSGPGNSGGPVYGLITFSDGTVDWGVVGITLGGLTGEIALAAGIDD